MIQEFSEKLKGCVDDEIKLQYENQRDHLSQQAEKLQNDINQGERAFDNEKSLLFQTTELLKEYRDKLLENV